MALPPSQSPPPTPSLRAEVLEQAAYLGMAAMLVGPLFSGDVRNPPVSEAVATGGLTMHAIF